MANFLTPGELKTHLYEETVNEITRNDDSIIDDAIDTAIDEIKGYLHAYDIAACIDNVGPDDRNKKLLHVCKDIAAFHLINLCNVNTEYDKRSELYDNAITWLTKVQKGAVVPGLPIPAALPEDAQSNQSIKWKSNPKRSNHF